MKRLAFAAALVCLTAWLAAAQDPVKVSPEHYKVEIDNPYVRVLRATRGPYEKAPMHEHPDYIAVYLKPMHQKITLANGTVQEPVRKAGEVSFSKAVRHEEENLADQPLGVLVVELKPGAPAPGNSRSEEFDPVKIDPAHHKVEFENDRVRVIRSVREPHAKIPMHEHLHYVTIALTDVKSKTTRPDGTTAINQRKAGDVAWRDPVKHAVENLGDERMEEIQIEFK